MATAAARSVLSLDGEWLYRQDPQRQIRPNDNRTGWATMRLPVNWYKTELGDFSGVVWFAREFTLPQPMAGRSLTLRFEAVDYIADVWLNGVHLGRHEGFFGPFEFRVGSVAREGVNSLVVRVDSPKDPSEYRRVSERPGFETPMSEDYKTAWPVALTLIKGCLTNFWHRPGWQTRFGQDGNTGGIWQTVELIATGPATLESVKVCPLLVRRDGVLDGTALVCVDVELYNSSAHPRSLEIAMEIKGKNFEGGERVVKVRSIVAAPGSSRVKLVQTLVHPQLWWCWDHGKPNLYELRLTAAAPGGAAEDERVVAFGVRECRLDDKGHWVLNGRRVFLRGMRYLSSIWLSEGNERMFREDLGRMRELNINAVRIGSHVEKAALYDLCDEMGLLVWQVFPMHWGNYSDADELIERAAPMMREMVSMLYNHASIVAWSVYKEPEVYPWADSRPNLYGRLCEVLKETAQTVDPVRWVHKGDYKEGCQNVTTGGWGETWWDYRKRVDPATPQKVEFGTTALAPIETVREILGAGKMWPPDWDRWYYLNVDPNWFKLQGIDVESKSGIEELIEEQQSWEARQVKESVEYLRQRKYDPTASMFLYFWNDPWPCLGGAGLLDYYRRKYKSYDIFAMVYSPVLASIEWIKEQHYVGFAKSYRAGEILAARLWVTNDLDARYESAALAWSVSDAGARVLERGSLPLDVEPDSSRVCAEVAWPIPAAARGAHRMDVQLRDRAGAVLSANYFEFTVGEATP